MAEKKTCPKCKRSWYAKENDGQELCPWCSIGIEITNEVPYYGKKIE